MGESERTSAGATRTRMREILNYRCECELGIRNKMGTFMILEIFKKSLKINRKLSLRNCPDGIFDSMKKNVIKIKSFNQDYISCLWRSLPTPIEC